MLAVETRTRCPDYRRRTLEKGWDRDSCQKCAQDHRRDDEKPTAVFDTGAQRDIMLEPCPSGGIYSSENGHGSHCR